MKIISPNEAAALVKSGDRVLAGGFLGCGSALECLDALVARGTSGLTLVANDTAYEDFAYGKLIANLQISHLIASHIGSNRLTGELINAGRLTVELVPQGTLAERIRAGGFGLGGVLVATGLKTEVEKGKQKVVLNGREFLVEEAICGDVALVYATKADKFGNLWFEGTTRNFNTVMAMAAKCVVVEVEELVEALDPNDVVVSGIVVNFVVVRGGEKSRETACENVCETACERR